MPTARKYGSKPLVTEENISNSFPSLGYVQSHSAFESLEIVGYFKYIFIYNTIFSERFFGTNSSLEWQQLDILQRKLLIWNKNRL